MPKRVTPPEAAELMKQGWRYLDVRSVPEFEAGHPEGALNVPLLHMQNGRLIGNPDFQSVVEGLFAKDDPLVVGCKMGGRSLQAATLMEAAGFTQIVDVRGGFAGERDPYGRVTVPGWADSGLPVSTASPEGSAYAELAAKVKAP
ncbi:MAG: rhodanese-like domain-containing protein [Myxococcales bacterium]|nr:rhodanese-like domain-containing protein [Myxococcales bacterium]